jgi:hypothetical protein
LEGSSTVPGLDGVVDFKFGVVGDFGVDVDFDSPDDEPSGGKVYRSVFLTVISDERRLDLDLCSEPPQEPFLAGRHPSSPNSLHLAFVVAPRERLPSGVL